VEKGGVGVQLVMAGGGAGRSSRDSKAALNDNQSYFHGTWESERGFLGLGTRICRDRGKDRAKNRAISLGVCP